MFSRRSVTKGASSSQQTLLSQFSWLNFQNYIWSFKIDVCFELKSWRQKMWLLRLKFVKNGWGFLMKFTLPPFAFNVDYFLLCDIWYCSFTGIEIKIYNPTTCYVHVESKCVPYAQPKARLLVNPRRRGKSAKSYTGVDAKQRLCASGWTIRIVARARSLDLLLVSKCKSKVHPTRLRS